jgi:hypothetical protein
MNGSSTEDTYLDLLRKMVPGRTLSLYMLLIGVVSGFAKTAADIVKELGWALLVVAIVCLGINFFARLLGLFGAQKGIKSAIFSSIAFLLLTMTQRATGPLAALGLDSQPVYIGVVIAAIVYVSLVKWFWPKQAEG